MNKEDKKKFVPEIELSGKDAIDLWLKGRNEWNKWADPLIKEKKKCFIDFAGVDFASFKEKWKGELIDWPFKGYHFCNGLIEFSGCNFGSETLNFQDTIFTSCNLNFYFTTFCKEELYLTDSVIIPVEILFQNSIFTESEINFGGAIFKHSNVYFGECAFVSSTINFFESQFEQGQLNFNKSEFAHSTITCNGSEINVSSLNFIETSFYESTVDFYNCNFKGIVDFQDIKNASSLHRFSFLNCTFDKALKINSKEHFGCVIDLRGTELNNHIPLQDIFCKLSYNKELLRKNIDKQDVYKLIRLKELAELNKDHNSALRFHADEMRAKRWQAKHINKFESFLDLIFDWACNYGQSILRPFILLSVSICLYGFFYSQKLKEGADLLHSIGLSTLNALGFLNLARDTRDDVIRDNFIEGANPFLNGWGVTQALISLALIFLIGLGLRNRFRI